MGEETIENNANQNGCVSHLSLSTILMQANICNMTEINIRNCVQLYHTYIAIIWIAFPQLTYFLANVRARSLSQTCKEAQQHRMNGEMSSMATNNPRQCHTWAEISKCSHFRCRSFIRKNLNVDTMIKKWSNQSDWNHFKSHKEHAHVAHRDENGSSVISAP